MVKITKNEAEKLRQKMPDVYIVVVGKFAPARKKTRFVEETKEVVSFLKAIRETENEGMFVYGKQV